jgi:hypothetical protein
MWSYLEKQLADVNRRGLRKPAVDFCWQLARPGAYSNSHKPRLFHDQACLLTVFPASSLMAVGKVPGRDRGRNFAKTSRSQFESCCQRSIHIIFKQPAIALYAFFTFRQTFTSTVPFKPTMINNEQQSDEAPLLLSESDDLDDEQLVLQKLLTDFDPNFDLFSNALESTQPHNDLSPPSLKRQVSDEHPESPSPKKLSPASDADERRARNELWKQSLKRSMFKKHASENNS